MTERATNGVEPHVSLYDRLLVVLAGAGALILGLIVVLITLDVLLRSSGVQPLAHTLALSEYGLLYATLLGAPWLLRTQGHVHVEIVVAAMPPGARWLMIKTACLLGLIACVVVAWAAGETAYLNFTRDAFDMRSFDMPRWLLFGPIAPSFLLMAIEFWRFLIGAASLYGDGPDQTGHA